MKKGEDGVGNMPSGLILIPDFLTASEEGDLLAFIRGIEFRTLQMHGVTAKRRIKQYGSHYAFETYRLTATEPIPNEFEAIRARSATLAGIDASQWAEVLVTEYASGAGIGWHRDAPAFGIVAGISARRDVSHALSDGCWGGSYDTRSRAAGSVHLSAHRRGENEVATHDPGYTRPAIFDHFPNA
jgi:alkylated DNA repair protein (DNA oxidative demethylase)